MAAIKRHVTIAETADGWELRDGDSVTEYNAAASAQAAVQAADKNACSKNSKPVITTITWVPISKYGVAVIRVITGK